MNKLNLVTVALLLAIPSVALAQANKEDSGSLSTKAMSDQPGNQGGGSTATPGAKPDSGSLSEKAMKDQPGNSGGGSTASPNTKPADGSLSGKAMKDSGN